MNKTSEQVIKADPSRWIELEVNAEFLRMRKQGRPKPPSARVSQYDFESIVKRLGAKVEHGEPDANGWDSVWITLHTAAGAIRVEPDMDVENGTFVMTGVVRQKLPDGDWF